MKYLLKNIAIETRTNSRGDYSWMQADLFNDEDVFANPTRLPRYYVMTDAVIEMYRPYATIQDPTNPKRKLVNVADLSKAIADGTVPDILHISQVYRVTVPLDEAYARKYNRDVTGPNGNILHKAGDLVSDDRGNPIAYKAITLHIKKYLDNESGEWQFVEEPQALAMQVLSRNYVLLQRSTVPAEAPGGEPEHTMTQEEEIAMLREQLANVAG